MRKANALILVAVAACTRKLDGPVPAPTLTAPAAACVVQKTTAIALSGSGFAPLYSGALKAGRVELPAILLARKLDLAGAATADAPVTLPDDPDATNVSKVHWIDDGHMSFVIDPSLALTPGLYDVEVMSPANPTGTLQGGLLAVPPPRLDSIAPDLACDAQGNTFILKGDYFLTTPAAPTVFLGSKGYLSTASSCRALPGPSGVQACTQLSITVPANDLPTGDYAVKVVNPDPVGCSSVEGRSTTFVGPPQVNQVIPPSVCSAAPTVPLTIQGSGFLTIAPPGQAAAAPTVKLGDKTYTAGVGNCAALAHVPEAVQVCRTLTVSIPGTAYPVGSYPLTVTNPAPANCTSSPAVQVASTPPPVVSSISPAQICASGDTLVLNGTGFEAGAGVTLTPSSGTGSPVQAAQVTVNSTDTTATALMPQLVPPGTYGVSLSNPDGCSAAAPTTLKVVPGPIAYFVDPALVYNGISVQATVYGANISPPVVSITATPSSGAGAPVSLTFAPSGSSPNRSQILIPKGLAAGSYDLTVRDQSSCPALLSRAFTVVDQATLALATPAANPPFGALSTATGITIQGTGFVSVPRVYLNPVNPTANTVAAPVGAVSFVDSSHLTALVPDSLPAGSYDLIVVNPDGKVGVAAGAFTVEDAAHPPPTISGLSPGSISVGSSVNILGQNFRAPVVTLSCLDSSNAPTAAPAVTVNSFTATSVNATPGSTAAASCVVRVTDADVAGSTNNPYAEYSALVFTNPAAKLYNASQGPDLVTARRAAVALGGDATTAARFLHVLGGDNGTDGSAAFDTVESSALSLIGVPGAFAAQRNHLTRKRTFAAGARLGRWLYVAGGSTAGVATNTVERAFVLDPGSARRTQITDVGLDVDPNTGLAPGLYYYRVAAVMPSTDTFNPSGEELPSDPQPVQLPSLTPAEKFTVTVTWKAVPGAAGYVVYRSATPGAAAGTEVAVQRINTTATSFADSGAAPIAGAPAPLPIGSLGAWQSLPFNLSVAREGAGAAVAIDPAKSNQAYLYVLGGRADAATSNDSYEYVPIVLQTDGSQPLGTISGTTVTAATAFIAPAATIGGGRWQVSASAGTNDIAPVIPAGTTYLYLTPGLTAAGAAVNTITVAQVQAGGALSAFITASNSKPQAYGCIGIVAADRHSLFGGGGTPTTSIVAGNINNPPPTVQSYSSGQTMLVNRYLQGGVLHGAFIYMVSGVTALPATLTASTEYRVW